MKNTLKKSIIIVIVIVVLLVISGVIYAVKVGSEVSKMTPLETKQINNVIFSIKDSFVNMYLVKGDNTYIAVDAGNDPDNIKTGLKALGIDPLEVSAVFLTHSDSDHVAGLNIFKNATVYLPQDEEQMINGKTARFAIFHNNKIKNHTELKNGQEVMVPGIIVSCISTPGHTPGAMSFIVNGNFLFTGDSLSLKTGRADVFSRFFNMDTEKQKETLKNISAINGITHIFTAHHGMTDNYEKAFESWK